MHCRIATLATASDDSGRAFVSLQGLAEELSGPRYRRRVLRYDNYGRGFSGCDGSPHTAALFAGQLAELLFALGPGLAAEVDLVGYSMGGVIAAAFAGTTAGRACVRSLALVAPAGTAAVPLPPYLPLVLMLPRPLPLAVARFVMTSPAALAGAEEWERPLLHLERFQRFVAAQERRTQRAEPALARSIVSTLEHFPLAAGGEEVYRRLGSPRPPVSQGSGGGGGNEGRRGVGDGGLLPVLAVWGGRDGKVPFPGGVARLQALVPQVLVEVHPEAKHALPIEHPGAVAKDIYERLWRGLGGAESRRPGSPSSPK